MNDPISALQDKLLNCQMNIQALEQQRATHEVDIELINREIKEFETNIAEIKQQLEAVQKMEDV